MNKQEEIIEMFNKISTTYDIANRILSMGIDKLWRKKACNMAYTLYNKGSIDKIVDVACGTGDMMIDWRNIAQENNINLDEIIGIDPSLGMINIAKKKIQNVNFLEAKAQKIPLKIKSVDILSIAYGIRNVSARKTALREFVRVLKPNGLLVILEFTKDDKDGPFSAIKKFYMNKIMPYIGGLISKNKKAYEYLPKSIDEFITSKKLTEELNEVGLKPIYIKEFSLNISTTIIARKI